MTTYSMVALDARQLAAFEYAALRAGASPDGEFLAKIAQAYLDEAASEQDAKDAWVGMPEFEQPDNEAHRKIVVNFKNEDDVHKFAEVVGQSISDKTRYVWYPAVERNVTRDKRYVSDES